MNDKNPDPSHIRLAKRVADQLNCSRSTAEQFVEGGFVSVDGQVVEAPGARVRPDQAVTVAPELLESVIRPSPISAPGVSPKAFLKSASMSRSKSTHWFRRSGPDSTTIWRMRLV